MSWGLVTMGVYDRIQSACRTEYVSRMASVTGVELIGESLWSLVDEVVTQQQGTSSWVPMEPAEAHKVGVRLGELLNEATGTMMHLWLASEDRLRVTRPTSTAWMDRPHSGRLPARRAEWIDEWVPLP